MRPLIHGLRATYKQGCRCVPCRAAEAAYRAQVRDQHRRGRLPFGAVIAAQGAWTIVRMLLSEGWSRTQIGHDLGLKWGRLQIGRDVIRLRTLLRLRYLARQRLRE